MFLLLHFVAVVLMHNECVIDFVVTIFLLLPVLPVFLWLSLLPCLLRWDVNIK
jgi:hypothetical protein